MRERERVRGRNSGDPLKVARSERLRVTNRTKSSQPLFQHHFLTFTGSSADKIYVYKSIQTHKIEIIHEFIFEFPKFVPEGIDVKEARVVSELENPSLV